MSVLNLDCRHGLAMLPDCSVDAILTDPPYHLVQNSRGGSPQPGDLSTPFGRSGPSRARGFMGHEWDGGDIAFQVELWREALRVLKPGGHMLAFSGSRTYHRMTCAIEDAGFEVRDSIMWVYGSGFPKSLDISKAIDKIFGAERQVVGQQFRAATGRDEGYGFGESFDITAPATLAAQIWEGWGTGLKPAHEPICVARKPMAADTVAANILAHGVGGINIDGCRVPIDPVADASQLRTMRVSQHDGADGWGMNTTRANPTARVLGMEGRWPANFIHDGSPEVLALFPETAPSKSGGKSGSTAIWGDGSAKKLERGGFDDAGSAARFFQQCHWTQEDLEAALFYYCAKASKRDKDEGLDHVTPKRVLASVHGAFGDSKNPNHPRRNPHPTVKPTALMRYLARLICPAGGTILDIFAGSGSTGKAAILEGFQFIGFELDPQYTAIANARLEAARNSYGNRQS